MKIMNDETLAAALQYAGMGWSIIPVGRDKKPLIKTWKEYQNKHATKKEIRTWCTQFPDMNIGAVTGSISGIAVIDIDTTEKINKPLPVTITSRTGGGGQHVFCAYPQRGLKNSVGVIPHVDLRGDGGYVVLPPSTHASGNAYEWIIAPGEEELATLPDWVFAAQENLRVTDWSDTASLAAVEGERNNAATQVAGKLLRSLPPDSWELGWLSLKQWNAEKAQPPLSEKELRAVFESIAEREKRKRDTVKDKATFVLNPVSLSELVTTDYKETQWLVDGLIPHEAVTIISGAPRSYKTFLTLDIALKIACGEKLFDQFATKQSAVLIVDEENHPRVLKNRTNLLAESYELPIYVSSRKGFSLNTETVSQLITYAKDNGVGTIIFDSLICIHGADENIASEMRNVMKFFKDITSSGVSVIVIHHHRKKGNDQSNSAEDMRGSSDILAQVDCHLAVGRKGNEACITIHQHKLREAQEKEPFVVRFQSDGEHALFTYGGVKKGKSDKKDAVQEALVKVLQAVETPLIKKELWQQVEKECHSVGHSTFKTVVDEMVADSQLYTQKGKGNSVLCSLTAFVEQNG